MHRSVLEDVTKEGHGPGDRVRRPGNAHRVERRARQVPSDHERLLALLRMNAERAVGEPVTVRVVDDGNDPARHVDVADRKWAHIATFVPTAMAPSASTSSPAPRWTLQPWMADFAWSKEAAGRSTLQTRRVISEL